MKRFGLSLTAALGASLFCARSSTAALLVTEYMPNPPGTDAVGEWMEIYNSGPVAIDISNYKVGDEESTAGAGTEGMFQFPSGTTIQAGQVMVIAITASGFVANYPGLLPDFEFINDQTTLDDPTVPNMTKYTSWATGNFAMGNTGDHALIVNDLDQVVDIGSYGSVGFMIPAPASGQSYMRVPPDNDTNTGADWQLTDFANTTPGQVPEPAALGLLGLAGLAGIRRRK